MLPAHIPLRQLLGGRIGSRERAHAVGAIRDQPDLLAVQSGYIERGKADLVRNAEAGVGDDRHHIIDIGILVELEGLFIIAEISGELDLLRDGFCIAGIDSSVALEAVFDPSVAGAGSPSESARDLGRLFGGHVTVVDQIGEHIVAVQLRDRFKPEGQRKTAAREERADVDAAGGRESAEDLLFVQALPALDAIGILDNGRNIEFGVLEARAGSEVSVLVRHHIGDDHSELEVFDQLKAARVLKADRELGILLARDNILRESDLEAVAALRGTGGNGGAGAGEELAVKGLCHRVGAGSEGALDMLGGIDRTGLALEVVAVGDEVDVHRDLAGDLLHLGHAALFELERASALDHDIEAVDLRLRANGERDSAVGCSDSCVSRNDGQDSAVLRDGYLVVHGHIQVTGGADAGILSLPRGIIAIPAVPLGQGERIIHAVLLDCRLHIQGVEVKIPDKVIGFLRGERADIQRIGQAVRTPEPDVTGRNIMRLDADRDVGHVMEITADDHIGVHDRESAGDDAVRIGDLHLVDRIIRQDIGLFGLICAAELQLIHRVVIGGVLCGVGLDPLFGRGRRGDHEELLLNGDRLRHRVDDREHLDLGGERLDPLAGDAEMIGTGRDVAKLHRTADREVAADRHGVGDVAGIGLRLDRLDAVGGGHRPVEGDLAVGDDRAVRGDDPEHLGADRVRRDIDRHRDLDGFHIIRADDQGQVIAARGDGFAGRKGDGDPCSALRGADIEALVVGINRGGFSVLGGHAADHEQARPRDNSAVPVDQLGAQSGHVAGAEVDHSVAEGLDLAGSGRGVDAEEFCGGFILRPVQVRDRHDSLRRLDGQADRLTERIGAQIRHAGHGEDDLIIARHTVGRVDLHLVIQRIVCDTAAVDGNALGDRLEQINALLIEDIGMTAGHEFHSRQHGILLVEAPCRSGDNDVTQIEITDILDRALHSGLIARGDGRSVDACEIGAPDIDGCARGAVRTGVLHACRDGHRAARVGGEGDLTAVAAGRVDDSRVSVDTVAGDRDLDAVALSKAFGHAADGHGVSGLINRSVGIDRHRERRDNSRGQGAGIGHAVEVGGRDDAVLAQRYLRKIGMSDITADGAVIGGGYGDLGTGDHDRYGRSTGIRLSVGAGEADTNPVLIVLRQVGGVAREADADAVGYGDGFIKSHAVARGHHDVVLRIQESGQFIRAGGQHIRDPVNGRFGNRAGQDRAADDRFADEDTLREQRYLEGADRLAAADILQRDHGRHLSAEYSRAARDHLGHLQRRERAALDQAAFGCRFGAGVVQLVRFINVGQSVTDDGDPVRRLIFLPCKGNIFRRAGADRTDQHSA